MILFFPHTHKQKKNRNWKYKSQNKFTYVPLNEIWINFPFIYASKFKMHFNYCHWIERINGTCMSSRIINKKEIVNIFEIGKLIGSLMENGQSFQSISTSNRNINMNEKRWKTNPTQKKQSQQREREKAKNRLSFGMNTKWIMEKCYSMLSKSRWKWKKKNCFSFSCLILCVLHVGSTRKQNWVEKSRQSTFSLKYTFDICVDRLGKNKQIIFLQKNRIYSDYLERNAI